MGFYQRSGVATNLFLRTLSHLENKGYEKFIYEAINPHSLKIVENHCPDAKRLKTIKYSEFTLENGEKPFQNLAGEAVFGGASVKNPVKRNQSNTSLNSSNGQIV